VVWRRARPKKRSSGLPSGNQGDARGFAKLLEYIRKGDTLSVYAIDRLGRDALDVQATVKRLIDKGVCPQALRILAPSSGPCARSACDDKAFISPINVAFN